MKIAGCGRPGTALANARQLSSAHLLSITNGRGDASSFAAGLLAHPACWPQHTTHFTKTGDAT